ncbi:MAG: hypothetical protein ACTSWN_07765 [Promethearchaeota archaeon]
MKIIDFQENIEGLNEYSHLVEYQIKPDDIPEPFGIFKPREIFPTGRLLCGDLIVNETSTKQVEMHPFPEWVVQLLRLDTKDEPVDGYCVALNMEPKVIKKQKRKDWKTRTTIIKEFIKGCSEQDVLAFKMAPGICLKVNANVPHYFISGTTSPGSVYPYMQVFEPAINWEELAPFGKVAESTAYFTMPFEIKI